MIQKDSSPLVVLLLLFFLAARTPLHGRLQRLLYSILIKFGMIAIQTTMIRIVKLVGATIGTHLVLPMLHQPFELRSVRGQVGGGIEVHVVEANAAVEHGVPKGMRVAERPRCEQGPRGQGTSGTPRVQALTPTTGWRR